MEDTGSHLCCRICQGSQVLLHSSMSVTRCTEHIVQLLPALKSGMAPTEFLQISCWWPCIVTPLKLFWERDWFKTNYEQSTAPA